MIGMENICFAPIADIIFFIDNIFVRYIKIELFPVPRPTVTFSVEQSPLYNTYIMYNK